MAISNLGQLRARVADYLARPESDIATEFTNSVDMFEKEFNDDPEMRLAEMETFATLTVINGTLNLPDDFIQLRNVVGPDGSVSGSFYLSGSTLVFPADDAEDDGISEVTLSYYAKVPPLVNDTDTNWLLRSHPYLYLYGVLAALGFWLADATQIGVISQRYEQAKENLKGADRSRRWGGMAASLQAATP